MHHRELGDEAARGEAIVDRRFDRVGLLRLVALVGVQFEDGVRHLGRRQHFERADEVMSGGRPQLERLGLLDTALLGEPGPVHPFGQQVREVARQPVDAHETFAVDGRENLAPVGVRVAGVQLGQCGTPGVIEAGRAIDARRRVRRGTARCGARR
jgi:hypothetical protein